MKRQMRRCSHCHCYFEVCKKVKKHEYCKKKECQKARKRKWQKQKMQNDCRYKEDQEQAQADWRKNNPDYWKKYRRKNKAYTKTNRKKQKNRNQARKSNKNQNPRMIAKMDTIYQEKTIFSGKYELVPFVPGKIAKMDAIIVEINNISDGYSEVCGVIAKMDV